MNEAALAAFLRAARGASRVGREPAAEPGALLIDLAQAFAYRATAMHLDDRLPAGAYVDAAFGGLQDSAPRVALYGLHARVNDVPPDAWEHPSLVQIWFRLGADYVIPRDDLGVFTIGVLPRDGEQATALNELGDLVRDALGGRARRTRDVESTLAQLPNRFLIRTAQVTGKIVIRWDARTTEVIPVEDPKEDPEDARLELARRFLHWFGPAGPLHFARWAAVARKDALETWERLDVVPVSLDGRARWILASDEAGLRKALQPQGVRLLPGGADPYLYLDHPPVPRVPSVGPDVTQRLINSLAGRILVDGELVGAWGRVQEKVTLFPWSTSVPKDRVTAEAENFAGPLGKPAKIVWLS